MARTQARGTQVLDGSITKDDIDIVTTGKALITRLSIADFISMSSTGVDAGTGVVSLSINRSAFDTYVGGSVLTGYAVGSNTAIAATDTHLAAFGKIQGQINSLVPTSRTITINGTAFDLSANRSWTVTATEVDTLQTVTNRGNTTTLGIGVSSIMIATGGGTLGIYATSTDYISLKSYSNYTWLRNTVGTWNFQGYSATDDFTRAFQLYLPDTAGTSANGYWAELGQRISNATAGGYTGIKIVKYAGSAVQLGDLWVGNISAASINIGVNAVLHAGNYNSYAPTLTGGGVSGTWGINISGSAALAGYSRYLSHADGPRDLSDRNPNWTANAVIYDFVAASVVGGSGSYSGVMTFSPWTGTTASTGDSSYQLAFLNETGINGSGLPGLRLRKGIDTTWGSWYQIYHSGNLVLGNSAAWVGTATENTVVGYLKWKNYGNPHIVFDASAATSPTGSSISNQDSANRWTTGYPTLMGWNGTSTYGVRVDSALWSNYATYVNLLDGRTDATAYPVLWGVNQGTNPGTGNGTTYAFSCTGVTIQSSTGTLNANYLYAAGNVQTPTSIANDMYVTAGDGNGFGFWSGTSAYKVYMSGATNGTWGGRTSQEGGSDYNMYFKMSGATRGFVFRTDAGNVAGIGYDGTMYGKNFFMQETALGAGTTIDFLGGGVQTKALAGGSNSFTTTNSSAGRGVQIYFTNSSGSTATFTISGVTWIGSPTLSLANTKVGMVSLMYAGSSILGTFASN